MLKKLFILACVTLFQLACNKNVCCTVIDTQVRIHYKNQSGENLINSSEEYAADKIKIYYQQDGVFEYAFMGNLDHPNMHFIDSTQTNELILTVFSNYHYEGNFSETIIELNETTKDTMRCEFDLSGDNEICRNVWINGEEMGSRFFELVR